MSIQNFPQEILENIFKRLLIDARGQQQDLSNCSLVCQSWNLPACKLMFGVLRVNSIPQLVYHLAIQRRNIGVYCKTLVFTALREHEAGTIDEYELLFSLLPNLQEIILTSCSCLVHHLNQLSRHAKLIKNLMSISLPVHKFRQEEIQAFYLCVNAFKNSVLQLKLSSLGELILSADGSHGSFISFLPQFTSLRILHISNSGVLDTPSSPQLSMFSLMRLCPNLEHFSLFNSYLEPENHDINQTFDHSKLKILKITLPKLTKYHISYLVSNVTQLDQFYLDCGSSQFCTNSIDWVREIGSDNLNRFQNFLADIEKVDLKIGKKFKTDVTEYWPFALGSISNKRSIPTHIVIILTDIKKIRDMTIGLEKRADFINIRFKMEISQLISIGDIKSSTTIIIPQDLIKYEINSLSLHFFHNDIDISNTFCFSILESALNCFTKLYELCMSINTDFHNSSYRVRVSSKEINHIWNDLNKWNLPRRPTEDLNKLAYVFFNNVPNTKNITTLLKLLPYTKYLKLHACGLNQNNEFNFPLNLGNLRLQQLDLNVTMLLKGRSMKKNTLVLQIDETDQPNQRSCYRWLKEREIFEPVESSYLTQHNRYLLYDFNAIIINCMKVDKIILSTRNFPAFVVDLAIIDLKHND